MSATQNNLRIAGTEVVRAVSVKSTCPLWYESVQASLKYKVSVRIIKHHCGDKLADRGADTLSWHSMGVISFTPQSAYTQRQGPSTLHLRTKLSILRRNSEKMRSLFVYLDHLLPAFPRCDSYKATQVFISVRGLVNSAITSNWLHTYVRLTDKHLPVVQLQREIYGQNDSSSVFVEHAF
jgi:hypothetical protein